MSGVRDHSGLESEMKQNFRDQSNSRVSYPEDREELRGVLMNAVASIAKEVEDAAQESESRRTLAPAAVEALRRSGLAGMKSPREVGGAEAEPTLQIDVIEAVTQIDAAAGWALLIASGIGARVLSTMPDEAVAEVLTPQGLPFFAGSLKPDGTARAVDGGFEITGRWGWASGVTHADYVVAPAWLEDHSDVIWAVVPADRAVIHDNWFPLGMRGTGSSDFSFDRVFVGSRFISSAAPPVRGGALYRLGYGSAAHEHGIYAIALAQAALRTVTETAKTKRRGYVGATSVADRETFQAAIVKGELRITAARLLMVDTAQRLFASARDTAAPVALQAEARAVAVHCTSEALAVTTEVIRYAGASALMSGDPLEKIVRDLYTAQSHFFVSESAYGTLGQLRLGLTDKAPLL